MFDPISLWMQSSVFWMKIFKQQQEAYLRALGAFAEKIPHENCTELAREAEAMKTMLKSEQTRSRSNSRNAPGRKTQRNNPGKLGANRTAMASA